MSKFLFLLLNGLKKGLDIFIYDTYEKFEKYAFII